MAGERWSVLFPRRMVPVWVSDPTGVARPLPIAITPAMNVVLTAPRPTRSTPSLPVGGTMWTAGCLMTHLARQILATNPDAGPRQARTRAGPGLRPCPRDPARPRRFRGPDVR